MLRMNRAYIKYMRPEHTGASHRYTNMALPKPGGNKKEGPEVPGGDSGKEPGEEEELELELIQAHMAQKPVLRVEVGAHALRVRSVSREKAWASAGVQGALVSGCGCEAG